MEGANCGGGDAIDGEGPVCARGVAVGGAAFWGISGRRVDGGGWDFAGDGFLRG